jgi:hypothetical protein
MRKVLPQRCRLHGLVPGKPLTSAQNEAARAALRELLRREGNQKRVAAKLGVAGPTLSAFLSGRQEQNVLGLTFH